MSSLSISADLNPTPETAIQKWNLSDHLMKKLMQNGITHLFPVQAAVLPILMKTRFSSARISPGDIFCCAPTGSGKTLAYVLPIIETLILRVIPRIRALIILPTKDLAIQVRNTFDQYIKGANLKCILLTGQSSFSLETKSLFTDLNGEVTDEPVVDIVIATPGRLLDHLNNTKGFSLSHLRFLVIDEADRLLNQSYQNWLPNVLASADGSRDDLHPSREQTRRYKEFDFDQGTLMSYTPLQKLLFSATLNQNPAQMAPLKLHNTTVISVEDSVKGEFKKQKLENDDSLNMVLPPTLSEYMIILNANDEKPLTILTLVFKEKISGVIIFTKSVEAAHRLAYIFNEFSKIIGSKYLVQAISSDANKESRKKWISGFKDGKIDAIISSDLLARGIDFGESVATVINYDVPTSIQTYTHRVGRCARAGRTGTAYTILESHQAKWFKSEMVHVSRGNGILPEKIRFNQTQLKEYDVQYRQALLELEKSVKKPSGVDSHDSEPESSDEESSQTTVSEDMEADSDGNMDSEINPSILKDHLSEDKMLIDGEIPERHSGVVPSSSWWGPGWV